MTRWKQLGTLVLIGDIGDITWRPYRLPSKSEQERDHWETSSPG